MKAKSKIYYPDYRHYKPISQTIIRFAKLKYFVRVFLWHSKRQLRQVAFVPDYGRKSLTMKCPTAFTYVFDKNAKTNYLGDVHFCAGEISIAHIAHEVSHITTFWAFNNKYSLEVGARSDYNEKMAVIQGNLTRYIWRWLANQPVVIYLP